ncbi:MAG: hypothetical protein ACREQA_03560 [Candidatus Binatia bacterium]
MTILEQAKALTNELVALRRIIPNHHPGFTIDEACLPLGTALFCKLAGAA